MATCSLQAEGGSASASKTALPSLLMGAFRLSKMSSEQTEIFQNHDILIALLLSVISVILEYSQWEFCV